MSPTILARDGRLVAVVGSPGGRTIINTVLQVMLNLVDFRMDLQQAVAAPRIGAADPRNPGGAAVRYLRIACRT